MVVADWVHRTTAERTIGQMVIDTWFENANRMEG
jgi:hypothetical protein